MRHPAVEAFGPRCTTFIPPHPTAPLPRPPPLAAAGASLVEVYSAFAYEGPALVPRLKRQLAACLARDGFPSVAAAVGADHRKKK